MRLIVGLGNPTRKYHRTRHNVGFMVLAELAKKYGAGRPKSKFHGELVEATIEGQRALLLSPLTYMNRSGVSVHEARDFYKLPLENLLVVCDDLNLPLAKLRFRTGGSSGGQKGLADVIDRLGTEEFARLRIGIGSPPENVDATHYVLSEFNEEETREINAAVARAADAAACWVAGGAEDCMNRFN
ncbi:MAG TPA: aminoacyl-tRNA hydrolase [Thermoguttaceae bacterium]|nr:aminoacyl-tRNA hydrolase [Thermoguttaceae bacterium]